MCRILGRIGIVRLLAVSFCVSTPAVPALAGISWQPVAEGPNAVADFHTASNWTASIPDHESTPPGSVGTWFIEGAGGETPRNGFDGTITLSTPRDGSSAENPKLGAGSVGGGQANEITTLVISTDVTITGTEVDADGNPTGTPRQFRVGQQDWTDDDNHPWGIVQQTTGHVFLEMAADFNRGDLLLSNDKAVSAGGIWEVGGDASLQVAADVHVGEKANVKSPGAIFRVRGSNAGPITVGDRFMVQSDTATWDVSEVDLGGGFRHQFNRGKSVVEFVVDAGGVSPITVLDNLDLGSTATVTTPNLGTQTAFQPAFLRVKLSQPTTAGSGTYDPEAPGAGDVIVLFEADRLTALQVGSVPAGAEELLEGRFFEPDHTNDAGTSPHRALLDGFRINSDYAGAVYSWQINYFEGGGGVQDGVIDPAVILSGLQITGTPGDLNGDSLLDENDRSALVTAIASPPATRYDLLNAQQHVFDLNADGIIDHLDLVAFNTYFLAAPGLAGDFNGDMTVDAADYTIWRDNLGSNDALPNDDGLGTPIGTDHYNLWKTNFGMMAGSGALAAGAVPEPGTALICLTGALGMLGVRRRVL